LLASAHSSKPTVGRVAGPAQPVVDERDVEAQLACKPRLELADLQLRDHLAQ
jgi:hypothetical protein